MDYRITTLGAPEQHEQAAALYRSVFGYQDPSYGVSPRLLGSLADNGGSVVGALDADGRLVAFAFGFCGTDGGEVYHYSQAAVVTAELQGQGLGRLLKAAQREVALRHGMTKMRWTYDPMNSRNAHFNLDVLGARARWFRPDLFGPGTDRVVVEWDLTSAPVRAVGRPADKLLPLPADPAAVSSEIRQSFRAAFQDLLGRGLAAVSCVRVSDDTAVYVFKGD